MEGTTTSRTSERLTPRNDTVGSKIEGPCVIEQFLEQFRDIGDDKAKDAINQAVLNQLDSAPEDWLTDLVDVATCQNSDKKAVSDVLFRYRNEKPFPVTDKKLADIRSRAHQSSTPDAPSSNFKSGLPLKGETLSEYVSRRKDSSQQLSKDYTIVDCFGRDNTSKQDAPLTVHALDSILGIAGYLPEDALQGDRTREEIIKEFREHVSITHTAFGYSAGVSLTPCSSTNFRQDQEVDDFFDRFLALFSLYRRLARALEELQRSATDVNDLVYMKRQRSDTNPRFPTDEVADGPNDSSEQYTVEARTLDTAVIQQLLPLFGDFYKDLEPSKPRSLLSWGLRLCLSVPAISFITPLGLLAGLFTLFSVTLFETFYSPWSSSSVSLRRAAIQKFTSKASQIAKGQSISGLIKHAGPERNDDTEANETLHELAVLGQFLCLMLQSQIRGFVAPVKFHELVDRPIRQFRLQGFDRSASPIFVYSQRLSFCDRDFLVTDTSVPEKMISAKMQATPAALVRLWRPAKLVVRNEDPVSCSQPSCAALWLLDGFLTPATSDAGLQVNVWQWDDGRGNQGYKGRGKGHHGILASTPIDLHTEIRLGCRQQDVESTADNAPSNEARELYGLTDDTQEEEITTTSPVRAPELRGVGKYEEAAAIESKSSDDHHSDGEGSRPAQDALGPSEEAPQAHGCPWESENAEEARWKVLNGDLREPTASESSWSFDQVQAILGVQSQWSVTQMAFTWRHIPARLWREQLDSQGAELIQYLDSPNCVRLSLHTGVLERIRLRQVVEYMVSHDYVLASNCNGDDKAALLAQLRSGQSYETIVRENRVGHHLERTAYLEALTRSSLEKVKVTGVLNERLLLRWQRGCPKDWSVSCRRRNHTWFSVMTDTQTTSTLAYIVPNCIETLDCSCKAASAPTREHEWTLPEIYRLKTSISCSIKSNQTGVSEPAELLEDKSYWINHPRLNLLAQVIGSTQAAGQRTFFLAIRRSLGLRFIKKYTTQRLIRENLDEDGTYPCIVGSGHAYERHVRDFLQTQNQNQPDAAAI